MKVFIKSRRNTHYAIGEYDGSKIVIKKGSKINMDSSFDTISPMIQKLRSDIEYVDSDGIVLKDLMGLAPSTAAQFITGRNVNGNILWRIDDKITLKEYKNLK